MNEKVKIAVLVSGGGTNLQALINAQHNGIIENGEITVVISDNENAYALTRAVQNGIETKVIKKDRNKKSGEFEHELIDFIDSKNIELIILAGFMKILSSEFTSHYKNRIINIHPSLIPSFCGEGYYGLKVHRAALQKGVKITGATVHIVNEIPDGGKILMQKAVEVLPDDTPETLQRRVMEEAEWIIFPKAAQMCCEEIIKERTK